MADDEEEFSARDEDWGPEQSVVPEVGAPFLLKLTPDSPPLKRVTKWFPPVYRLVSPPTLKGHLELECQLVVRPFITMRWCSGHSWNLSYSPSFRPLLTRSTPSNARGAAGGCTCHRCGSLNAYAAPNRPDGSYVCYECR